MVFWFCFCFYREECVNIYKGTALVNLSFSEHLCFVHISKLQKCAFSHPKGIGSSFSISQVFTHILHLGRVNSTPNLHYTHLLVVQLTFLYKCIISQIALMTCCNRHISTHRALCPKALHVERFYDVIPLESSL